MTTMAVALDRNLFLAYYSSLFYLLPWRRLQNKYVALDSNVLKVCNERARLGNI